MDEILKVLLDSGTGIIQMPCPHLTLLWHKCKKNNSSENYHHLINSMKEYDLSTLYSGFLSPVFNMVEEYKKQEFEIVGLIGVKGSPTCEMKSIDKATSNNQGLFMEILKRKLKEITINTSMVNIDIPVVQ